MAETLQEKQARLKEAAILQAELLYHYKLIARSIGKTEETLIAWRKDDPEFSDRLEQARIQFLNKKIKVAKPEFLLERLEPEIFKERKEWDGKLTGDVQFINEVPRPGRVDGDGQST